MIQDHVGNALDADFASARWVAGVIGASPSRYSKSPHMWNAAFAHIGAPARYAAMDVEPAHLAPVLAELRADSRVLGVNVTVPYKLDVLALVDHVDATASAIGAANVIVREPSGRLAAYNTDAAGFTASLLQPLPGRQRPFLRTLDGACVLLIGAGGAAKAVASAISTTRRNVTLTIANRHIARAREIAAATGGHGTSLAGIPRALRTADLVVNASSVGQGGAQRLPDGRLTCLEPYSPLAPARTAGVATGATDAAFYRAWLPRAAEGIGRNNGQAIRTLLATKPLAAFVDLIYAPEETVFLRHARLAGHPTLNGRGTLTMQAVEGFMLMTGGRGFLPPGLPSAALRRRLAVVMAGAGE